MTRLLPLLALACMDVDKFSENYSGAYCAMLADCEALDVYGYSSSRDCENNKQALPEDCDTVDGKQSRDCVSGIEAMTCEQLLAEQYPKTCKSVCADD